MKRRNFIGLSAASLALGSLSSPLNILADGERAGMEMLRPEKLMPGDDVGIIAPGTAVSDPDDIMKAIEICNHYKLTPVIGDNVINGAGYKTRTVEERLEDLHDMFDDSDIKAVFCIRGGYGSAQLLPGIDYELIRDNPKIFLGYSDITAMHSAINKFSGLVTFHGPVMLSAFTGFTALGFEKLLFSSDAPGELKNPQSTSGIRQVYPTRTIIEGKAAGVLCGGNLSLIASLMGTDYEINTAGRILLLEDVGEQPYRIDRMLTQLNLAGKLEEAAGIIFGKCSGCDADGSNSTWDPALGEVLDYQLGNLKCPVFSGLLFGHTSDQLTIPLGMEAIMDADSGSIIIEKQVCRER